MSVSASDLSDPHYGFDLVVAVTQASINTTLKQLMAGLNAPEVTLCYVYDDHNNLVPIAFQTLVSDAKGSDPFAVPDGANPATNQDLINLAAANFAGAVRARLGLPNVPLANIPPIATLGAGSSAPVLFNLLCAEFQITGFQYGRGSATWINKSQPSGAGSPWYFSANVQLNSTTINPDSPVPPAVQQRIAQLQHDPTSAFTIQKLFLDLNTAILESSPTIEGIPPGWPVWNLINTVFLGSYFAQLRRNGDPVLNYSFTMVAPRPATLQLGSIARECLPLMDHGQPISNPTPAQQQATTLVYVGTTSTTPPIPVPFAWNWVEPGDVNEISGVQAVRRDVFFNFLAGLINQQVGSLCIDTYLEMTHSGEKSFTIRYWVQRSSAPRSFQPVATIPPPDGDGFTTLLTINDNHNAHADETSGLDLNEIWGDYNYTLTGSVAVSQNQIRVQVRAQVYMLFGHREVLVDYTDLPGKNYYDKTLTVVYTLGVGQNGALQVTETHGVTDQSAPWDFDPKGILGKFGFENALKNGLTTAQQSLASSIDSSFTGYVQHMTEVINGYQGWVFPGNDAFTFKNVAFSTGHDLIAHLTYVNPN